MVTYEMVFRNIKVKNVLTTQGAMDFSTSNSANSTSTAGTLITTASTWQNHSTAGQCAVKLLCSNSATTGDYATIRARARSDAAGATVCVNASASAGANDYGNLYAVQGYAQPNAYTQAGASNIVCGVYSCIDMGGATQNGRAWSMWVDTHTTKKAAASDYLMRLSHNGSATSDGVFTIYQGGRTPVLFNFEDASGCLTDSGTPGSTAAGYIAVKTPAGTKYISLFTA